MKIKCEIIDEKHETFPTKNGPRTIRMLVCQDTERPPLNNSFDYELTDVDYERVGAGKSLGKYAEVVVRDIRQSLAGRIRITGSLSLIASPK